MLSLAEGLTPGLVSISVVFHNELDWIEQCISMLKGQTYPSLELIIVDNCSSDGSRELLGRLDGKHHLLLNDANLGFAGGHNLGISASHGEFVLVINPDVFLEPGYVERLVASARDNPNSGAFGGKLLRMYRTPGDRTPVLGDLVGFYPLRNGSNWDRGAGQPAASLPDGDIEVFGVSGAAVLYRRMALDDVREEGDFFDESFFIYAEDVDLAWRLQLRGWSARCESTAVAWHARQAESAGARRSRSNIINWHLTKNRHLVFIKNIPGPVLFRNGAELGLWSMSALVYTCLFEPSSLSAYRELFRLIPRALRRRRKIMRRKMVGNERVLGWYATTEQVRRSDGLPTRGYFTRRLREVFTRTT